MTGVSIPSVPAPKEFVDAPELTDIHFDFDRYEIRPADAKQLGGHARLSFAICESAALSSVIPVPPFSLSPSVTLARSGFTFSVESRSSPDSAGPFHPL
jgi:hypothetical protein